MSGQPVTAVSTSRVLLVDGGHTHDVFEVLELTEARARVRTAFLFELGEEIRLRVEQGGAAFEVLARVVAHVGTGEDRVTELELGERTAAT